MTLGALADWSPQSWPVAPDWRELVNGFLASADGRHLADGLRQRLAAGATIFPAQPLRALALTALADVKVVLLGQDPYHGTGQAHGLAFSVESATALPPSLRNIHKELVRDFGCPVPSCGFQGSLEGWARQGVLLLNTCLTVEMGQASSHARIGWDGLTNALIQAVLRRDQPVVFMLWGAHAQARQALISPQASGQVAKVLVLTANHPSPLSALRPPKPFIGCGHFSMANRFLQRHGVQKIEWMKSG